MVTTERKTAAERRVAILLAARELFAERGLHGTSTDDIARAAGISQPYLFRLFGTKKGLYRATVERCYAEMLELFRSASEGLRGDEALRAIGDAYMERLADRTMLRLQMQAYGSCDDPEICEVVRRGYGELVLFVERVSGEPPAQVSEFFAKGMLLNVAASMGLLHAEESWAQRLLEGCRE